MRIKSNPFVRGGGRMNTFSHARAKPKFALYMLAAVIGVACLMLALDAPNAAFAQAQGGDYDADNDGLIDINYLEQLDAVHYDLNGDGAADPDANATAYAAAFPNALAGMGCPNSGCVGYELIRSLDFNNPGSYASNAVRADWTSGGGWFPIGVRDFDHSFATIFEGNNNAIANLFIDDEHHQPDMVAEIAALFGRNEGTIRRVGVTNANVTGHYDVAALAGYNHGIIEDSYSSGVITGEHNIGGLVGENDEDAVITRSWSSATVYGPSDIGGLVGSNGGSITHSYATGEVNGDNEVGGLVGESHRSTISNCYATGVVRGFEHVGGLVGRNDRADITLSYATGDVWATGGFIGGLVGYSQGGVVRGRQTGEISFSYATGDVRTETGLIQYVGGLVGRAQSSRIIASYATGDIHVALAAAGGLVGANIRTDIIASYSTGHIEGFNLIGGLVGLNLINTINSSYSIGRVTAVGFGPPPAAGGLIGNDADTTAAGVVSNTNYVATYWDTERSTFAVGLGSPPVNVPRQTNPEGKTSAELQAPTDYTGIYAAWRADLDNDDGDDDPATGIDDFWDFGSSTEYPALKVDLNGDGIATWQEFGDQDRMPAPLPPPPMPEPTPEPTPVTNDQILESLQEVTDGITQALQALQAFTNLLNVRLAASDTGGAQPDPTPVGTPVTEPTPVGQADACIETLILSDTINGVWGSDCETDLTPPNAFIGHRYARFYAFTLPQESTVTITLTSEDNPDTYLYLLEGIGRDGTVLHQNDDIDTVGQLYGSRVSGSLPAGSYTIVATNFHLEIEGGFTLEALASVGATTQ